MTRGYLGRPAATAAVFVPDPDGHGGRRYRTGDAVHRRTDGALTCTGRLDRQLKIRGHRVEPAEVEHALAAHPAVRAVAVVGETRADGATVLVGYWVAEPGTPIPAPAELRSWVARRLPAPAVPAELRELDALPLTPGGKVDPDRLPDREQWVAHLRARVASMSDAEVAAALAAPGPRPAARAGRTPNGGDR